MCPKRVNKIVKAICILQNYVRNTEGKISQPSVEIRGTDDAVQLPDRICFCVNQPYPSLI